MFVHDSKEEESRMLQPDGKCFKIGGLGFILIFVFFLYGDEGVGSERAC